MEGTINRETRWPVPLIHTVVHTVVSKINASQCSVIVKSSIEIFVSSPLINSLSWNNKGVAKLVSKILNNFAMQIRIKKFPPINNRVKSDYQRIKSRSSTCTLKKIEILRMIIDSRIKISIFSNIFCSQIYSPKNSLDTALRTIVQKYSILSLYQNTSEK